LCTNGITQHWGKDANRVTYKEEHIRVTAFKMAMAKMKDAYTQICIAHSSYLGSRN
jgi:hypothetical protein